MKTKAPVQLGLFTKRVYVRPLDGKERLLAKLHQDEQLLEEGVARLEEIEELGELDYEGWETLANEYARLEVQVRDDWNALAPLVRVWWLS